MENTKKTFDCQCGNKYNHTSSLCVHRKKCSIYQAYKLANPSPSPNPNPKPNVTLAIQEKDDVSILSSTSTDSSIMRILELENELKLTELKNKYELRLKDQEMENILKIKNLELENQELKFELKLKNLEIEMLNKIVQAPAVQAPVVVQAPVAVQAPVVEVPAPVPQAPVQSPVQVKPLKSSTLDFLNSNLDDAYTIEDCFDILKNPDYNHYLYEDMITHEGVVKTIINPKFSLQSKYQSSTTNASDIIASLLHKFDKKELPFYICKKNKKSSLYIKSNNGWIKSSEKDADDLLVRFCDKALKSVSISTLNTYNIFKKAPSKYLEIFEINKTDPEANNFDKWQLNHKSEILSKLMIFKEDFDLAVKKLTSLLIKMDPNKVDEDE